MSHTTARKCASRVSHVQENSAYHHGSAWIYGSHGHAHRSGHVVNGWDTGGAGTVADPGTPASGPSSGTSAWRSDASAFPASPGPAMAGRYIWDVVHRLWGAPCLPMPVVCRHFGSVRPSHETKAGKCCSLTCGYTLFGRPPRAIFAVENSGAPRGEIRGPLFVRVGTDLRSAVSALLVSCALGDIRHELPHLFPRYGCANLHRPVISPAAYTRGSGRSRKQSRPMSGPLPCSRHGV